MKKNSLLLLGVGAMILFLACTKYTTLPPYSTNVIFQVNAKMTHAADTISSAGDTIWLTAQGNINDTTGGYKIAASLKATDTTVAANLIGGNYFKSVTVVYDTAGFTSSHLFHWKASLYLPIPAVASKTKIKTTAFFTYGLNLSSQTGNQTATDTKPTYAQ
jgi:hypothetical protein